MWCDAPSSRPAVLLLSLCTILAAAAADAEAETEGIDAGSCLTQYKPFGSGFNSTDNMLESFRGLFCFAMVAVAAWPLAVQFPEYLHLPMLNGWLLVGLLSGPYVLNVVTDDMMYVWGEHISMFAFSFIGLTAGYMMYGADLRPVLPDVTKQVFPVLLACLFGVGVSVGLLGDKIGSFLGDFEEIDTTCQFLIGILFGALMASGSPAECVALIHELKPKGPIVIMSVGVTIIKDVSAIVTASIVTTLLKISCGDGFEKHSIPIVCAEFFFSITIGLALGKVYTKVLMVDTSVYVQGAFIIGSALGVFEINAWMVEFSECHGYMFNVECLLLVLVASAVPSNNESTRKRMGHILASCSLPVFLCFFVYVGAHLNLGALVEGAQLAFALIVLRLACILLGSTTAGYYWNHFSPDLADNLWMCYLPQAGVTLAIASDVEKVFADSWGAEFNAVTVAVVLFFEVVGPIAMKLGFTRSGALSGEGSEGDDNKEALLGDKALYPECETGPVITVARTRNSTVDIGEVLNDLARERDAVKETEGTRRGTPHRNRRVQRPGSGQQHRRNASGGGGGSGQANFDLLDSIGSVGSSKSLNDAFNRSTGSEQYSAYQKYLHRSGEKLGLHMNFVGWSGQLGYTSACDPNCNGSDNSGPVGERHEVAAPRIAKATLPTEQIPAENAWLYSSGQYNTNPPEAKDEQSADNANDVFTPVFLGDGLVPHESEVNSNRYNSHDNRDPLSSLTDSEAGMLQDFFPESRSQQRGNQRGNGDSIV
jgi:Kef-type K+ transport system membrane component KefB